MKAVHIITSLVVAFGSAVMLTSCSSKGNQSGVEESDEQIEQARIAGREAARTFVNRQWRDTLELQGQMIEAGTRRAAYDSLPQSRAAYDSAFISTVRTVRPEVAAQLEQYRNRQ